MSVELLRAAVKAQQQLESAIDSLRAIANMQVQETTDFRELAALCISIAQIELAKRWEEN